MTRNILSEIRTEMDEAALRYFTKAASSDSWIAFEVPISGSTSLRVYSDDVETSVTIAVVENGYPTGERTTFTNVYAPRVLAVIESYVFA